MGSRVVGHRVGISIIWILVSMTALCALASLAVDFGRYQVVKSELRRAADAAARAAASNIANPTTGRQLAYDFALQNSADGQPVVLYKTNEDIKFGNWDPAQHKFTELPAATEKTGNAVQVFARRVAARQSAVPLMWARLLPGGANYCDATAYSIAVVGNESYGVVGLNSISMSGNSSDSYWSDGTGTTGSAGNIASNGTIKLAGGATIHGNAKGSSVTGGTVTGTVGTLATTLTFPNGDAGAYATSNDNGLIPTWAVNGTNFALGKNKPLTLPGGHYYFNNFTMATGSALTFTGPATIYCYGNFSMTGQTNTSDSLPKNLNLVMCPGPTGLPPGSVSITAGAALYANIYAPQSDISINGGGAIYGSVLGLNVSMSGGGSIHYDLSLKGTGGITMVK